MVETQASTSSRSSIHAYLILGIGIAAVSLAAILIRLAQAEDVPSLLIAAGRLTIATLLLTYPALRNPAYRVQALSLNRKDLMLLGVSGLFLAMHFAAWVTALEYTTVLISVVLVSTTPIWVALLEVFFLRAYLSQLVVAGLVIALAGGALIGLSDAGGSTAAGNPYIGGALSTIGAIGVAVYMVIGRKIRPYLALTAYLWLVYGGAALILLAAVALTSTPVAGHTLAGYGWVLAVALVPQLIGHSSVNYALAYLSATFVSLTTQLEPLLSAIIAYFVFAEKPGRWQIWGGVVIIIGVVLASLGQAKSTGTDEETSA